MQRANAFRLPKIATEWSTWRCPEQCAQSQPRRRSQSRPATAQPSRSGGSSSSCGGGSWRLRPEHDTQPVRTVFAVLCGGSCCWRPAAGSAAARRRTGWWSASRVSWRLSRRWLRRLSRRTWPTAAKTAQKRQTLRALGEGAEARAGEPERRNWAQEEYMEYGRGKADVDDAGALHGVSYSPFLVVECVFYESI